MWIKEELNKAVTESRLSIMAMNDRLINFNSRTYVDPLIGSIPTFLNIPGQAYSLDLSPRALGRALCFNLLTKRMAHPAVLPHVRALCLFSKSTYGRAGQEYWGVIPLEPKEKNELAGYKSTKEYDDSEIECCVLLKKGQLEFDACGAAIDLSLPCKQAVKKSLPQSASYEEIGETLLDIFSRCRGRAGNLMREKLGQHFEHRCEYAKSVTLNPKNRPSFHYYTLSYLGNGENPEAEAWYRTRHDADLPSTWIEPCPEYYTSHEDAKGQSINLQKYMTCSWQEKFRKKIEARLPENLPKTRKNWKKMYMNEAFIDAIVLKDMALIERCLAAGADIEYVNVDGTHALRIAYYFHRDLELTRFFLAKGASMYTVEWAGGDNLFLYSAVQQREIEFVKLFLEYDDRYGKLMDNPSQCDSVLNMTVKARDEEIAALLVARGTLSDPENCHSAARAAVGANNLKWLQQHFPSSIQEIPAEQICSLLSVALRRKARYEIFQHLLEQGCDPNQAYHGYHEPPYEYAGKSYLWCVKKYYLDCTQEHKAEKEKIIDLLIRYGAKE